MHRVADLDVAGSSLPYRWLVGGMCLNLLTLYKQVFYIRVCKCVCNCVCGYMGICMGEIAGESIFHVSKFKFHTFWVSYCLNK